MTRRSFRLALLGIVLFTVAIFLTHHEASGDNDLRALLLPPPNCAPPCFLGIRPGATTVDAGLEHLRANPLIRSISPKPLNPTTSTLSGLYDVTFAPAAGSMWTAQMQFMTQDRSDIIDSILIFDTGLQLDTVIMAVGKPASFILNSRFRYGSTTHIAFYPQYQMYIRMTLAVCSLEEGTFWNEQPNVVIGIANKQTYTERLSYYPADTRHDGEKWVHELFRMKRLNCA